MNDSRASLTRPKLSVLDAIAGRQTDAEPAVAEDPEEDHCPAFGFVRGIRDRSLAIEFRLQNGQHEFFSYALLGQFRFDPSAGILLRFGGDIITLVLIRGSNLAAPVRQNSINLTDRGLQRHRITFVREMDDDELKKAGDASPSIDRIEIAECETEEDVLAWLRTHAPAFTRPRRP